MGIGLIPSLKERIDLDELKDVEAPTPSDGDALAWDDATELWIASALAPAAHDLGGALHNAATLAQLNAKVSDATLIDVGTAIAFAVALGG